MLAVCILDGDGYGISVKKEVERHTDRSILLGAVHITLYRLQDKGLLDIYTRDELGEVYRNVSKARKHTAYPYCEDVDSFYARVFKALDEAIAESHGMRIAVVCHGGVINAVLSRVLGSEFDQLIPVHHTSISVMRAADTRRVILTVNDYSHVMPFQSSRGDVNA